MRDLLTEEECDRLWADCFHDEAGINAMLQSAARLGAERERERIAQWMDAQSEKIAAKEPYLNEDDTANKSRAWEAKLYAVAIRRGEEG